MHGLMCMWCCVSFQIITLVIVMHFIGKAIKEAWPAWMKWMGYLLLIAGLLGLICSFANGCRNMMHHKEECSMMSGACPAMKGGCDGGMKECHEGMMMKDGKKCCKGEKGEGKDDDDNDHHDSTKTK